MNPFHPEYGCLGVQAPSIYSVIFGAVAHHLLCDEVSQRVVVHLRPSICFVVSNPVLREVIAADFRDRVVHHYLFDYLTPMVERMLIYDCYSCRQGKGTSFGVDRLEHHMRACSHNYQREAYCLQLDIQSYFVSISHETLYRQVMALMDRIGAERDDRGRYRRESPKHALVQYLLEILIFHRPLEGAIRVGRQELFDQLPRSKSLRYARVGCGLPIGNLTSQLFSNIYLNGFDHYLKRQLGVRHYGRYVDDFYLIDASKEYLMSLVEPIRHVKLRRVKTTNKHKRPLVGSTSTQVGWVVCATPVGGRFLGGVYVSQRSTGLSPLRPRAN